jgi:predicted signal transduction protein with EAL and GGDEF domain
MTDRKTCEGCRNGAKFATDITMAFQPILDVRNKRMFAYEALLRGAEGEGAGVILSQVTDANRYAFCSAQNRMAHRARSLGIQCSGQNTDASTTRLATGS